MHTTSQLDGWKKVQNYGLHNRRVYYLLGALTLAFLVTDLFFLRFSLLLSFFSQSILFSGYAFSWACDTHNVSLNYFYKTVSGVKYEMNYQNLVFCLKILHGISSITIRFSDTCKFGGQITFSEWNCSSYYQQRMLLCHILCFRMIPEYHRM